MVKSLQQVFWGFMFILLDIRIVVIDTLPDFVGYFLIFVALGNLQVVNRHFPKGKTYAFILALLSIFDLLQAPESNLLTGSLANQNLILLILSQVSGFLQLILVYWICRGVYQMGEDGGYQHFQDSARFTWWLFFVSSSAVLLLTPFLLNLDPQWNILLIMLILVAFFALIRVMFLIKRAQKGY